MAEFAAELTKFSGSPRGGYGIVFCATSTRFLVAMIDTEGNYIVGAVEDGTWTPLNSGWKKSSALIEGYGMKNSIRVARVAENTEIREFKLFLNGTEAEDFFDSEGAIPASGAYGFICVIGTELDENFPDRPVKVSFKETIPADIGARCLGVKDLGAKRLSASVKMDVAIW
jgi:hypothetical protein